MGWVLVGWTTMLMIVPVAVEIVGKSGSIGDVWADDGAEGLLLALGEEPVGGSLWWDVCWETSGGVRMLVVVARLLGWEGDTSCFINVQQMTFKLSKCWESIIIQFSTSNVSIETLVGCGVEGVTASAANRAFEELSVSVGNACMITIASEDANAIQVGGCNLLVLLFQRTEGLASAFNVIRCEWCTVSAKCEESCSGIRGTINDMLLTWFRNVDEDQIVEGSANEWVCVGNLLRPEIEDLTRPRRNVADDT